jgi:DNA invertase Pin-like site-specific DNA recombinase
MKTEKRVAIYARVSTNSAQNPEMQIRELREYCKNRGWKIAGEFIDSGISGATDSRPQLNRLMADAHRRRFDVVAVWDFSRFARSTSHLLRALETFSSLGIGFVSLREQIDTSTPTGKMVFTILGSVAELERSLIGERVRAGLRNAKAKGQRLGRPPLKSLTASDVRQLRKDRRRSRLSFKQLAAKHGVSSWTAFQLCKSKGEKSKDF